MHEAGIIFKTGMQSKCDVSVTHYGRCRTHEHTLTLRSELRHTTFTCFADDKEVVYVGAELNELQLAWATTVHKSQGSECPVVVLALAPNHRPLLTRRLLYTGLSLQALYASRLLV